MHEQAIAKPAFTTTERGELLPAQTDVPRCFVCGQENPSGLKLRFTKGRRRTRGTPLTN